MLKTFFARDRLVMTGLIILGIVTVAAGFASGRATFQYALSTDAREASAAWVEKAERQLFIFPTTEKLQTLAGHDVKIIAPDTLARLRKKPQHFNPEDIRIARSVHEESGLLAGIDLIFSRWISGLTDLLDDESHVSRIAHFTVLDNSGKPMLRDGRLSPVKLGEMLRGGRFRAEFYKALGMRSARIISNFGSPERQSSEFRKLLIIPVMDGLKVSRIYALVIDQSSAATMSKVALIAASMMTSLLIVLGYSVPAAVAFRRIRERWKAEDQIRFLAMHDPLTGLPNRVQFQHRLDHAVARAKRSGTLMAVMCLDLDRFKDVNDTLGHQTGDILLQQAAKRLEDCVRETDVVARLGGDEFAIIAEDLDTPNGVIPVAQRICEALGKTFELNGHNVTTSGSVGISFAPTEGTDPETLLNNADLALYRAKHDGRNTFRFFEAEMDRAVQERRRMAGDLRLALRNNELDIHYQPHFDMETGRLTGYEALARWHHARDGDISPAVFIPLAEENGLISILGEMVLQNACTYALTWPEDTTLSVNISSAQLCAQDLTATICTVLEKTGFPAHRLLLEITENLLLKNTEETIVTLNELNELGVSLVLDDFGTGHSCLSYLTRFPVAKIKIDQSFVEKMETDKEMAAIINTIIGLGKSLDVTVTAEGVETARQAEHLRKLGCNEVQGFLFGRPHPEIRSIPSAPRLVMDPEAHGVERIPCVLDDDDIISLRDPVESADKLSADGDAVSRNRTGGGIA